MSYNRRTLSPDSPFAVAAAVCMFLSAAVRLAVFIVTILPGGMPGAQNLFDSPVVRSVASEAAAAGAVVGAICAAPFVLGRLGLLNGKKATCFPGFEDMLRGAVVCAEGVVTDGLVTTAKSEEDMDNVLSLYNDYEPYGLLAFCMGEAGRQSRIACLACGAPYTYAAYNEEESAAPGQWVASEMMEELYGERSFIKAEGLRMPASKSFAQRAIIAAALADGESHLYHYTPCEDSESALKVARMLGADVKLEDGTITIKGIAAGVGTADAPAKKPSLLTRVSISKVSTLTR